MSRKLIVIDLSSFIFRAFYAVRNLHAPDGTPVNALHGVLQMLLGLLSKQRPTHVVVARDSRGESFREKLYSEYKANRSDPPEALVPQFALVDSLIEKMKPLSIRIDGYEADDVIGSIVTQWKNDFDEIDIVSGDKDLMQFVGANVFMLDTMKDKRYGRDEVFEKMGVWPEQIVDYLSMVGDSSDNIPGMPGIGEKGAQKLIAEFGSLDAIIAHKDQLSGAKVKNAFEHHIADAHLSKELVNIVCSLELGATPEQSAFRFSPTSELMDFLSSLGFASSVAKLKTLAYMEATASIEETTPLLQLNESDTIDLQGTQICFDGKSLWKRGYRGPFFDLPLAHYLLEPDRRHDAATLLARTAPHATTKDEAMQILAESLTRELAEQHLDGVYRDMELPLVCVLAAMEERGVGLNPSYLHELETRFSSEIAAIQERISSFANADDLVNLRSPKQVAHLLYDVLKLPVFKENKTGPSTDSDVLSELVAETGHEVPSLMLQFRELDKLLSTYVTVLPTLVNPTTHKIHTRYNQTVAATGRLSSDNPNLQNIPVRSENGRLIRKAFVATPGNVLLSADYSQIELRILAHLSEDETMLRAFQNGDDIHAQTAAEIFDIPIQDLTKAQRNSAKAINFGLMYGQSSFGLSQHLHIPQKEARRYITAYFTKFARVKAYLDGLKEEAEKTGYAETLLGRKRPLPDIRSQNRITKSQAERLAINTPIQGTAADLIKVAMIRIEDDMRKREMRSSMILQVHDELIFDVVEEELNLMKELVRHHMESAIVLRIPLSVEMGMGVNWYDLK